MDQCTSLTRVFATSQEAEQCADAILDDVWATVRPTLRAIMVQFLISSLTPMSFLGFERMLAKCWLEFGRLILEGLLNNLEPLLTASMPHDVLYQGGGYRRLNERTPNRFVATMFGTITLWRTGYRFWSRGASEPTIFPLEMLLGLRQGATPALAERIGLLMAAAGACQNRVIHALQQSHGLSIGHKRLRAIVHSLSDEFAEIRQICQVESLIAAMRTAFKSSGNRLPVLAVGRDGVTLRQYFFNFYEVASVATITIYNRSGKRHLTLYLAHPPESLQVEMSRMLSGLLNEFFLQWDGPLPRLSYITDAGDNESAYFDNCLRHMVHPVTKKPLGWIRVVDFFHASQRISAMADQLFTDKNQRSAWIGRMRHLLKEASGPRRVLQSAASHLHRQANLTAAAKAEFYKAYNYIRSRTQYMQYSEYRYNHIPLGSGVTEAACKSLVAQRLKLSGMRWKFAGAKSILNLRIPLLSNNWQATYDRCVANLNPVSLVPYAKNNQLPTKIPA